MKDVYLIIGSNNFWYGIEDNITNARIEAKAIFKGTSEGDDMGGFADPESGHVPELPEKLLIYKAKEIQEIRPEGV